MAEKEAKDRIRAAVSDRAYQVSVNRAKHWHARINKAMFDGTLPTPEFEICRLRGAWAWCIADDLETTIKLNEKIDTLGLFLGCLSHEMVHQHQHLLHKEMHHGREFQVWKRRFRKLGIEI